MLARISSSLTEAGPICLISILETFGPESCATAGFRARIRMNQTQEPGFQDPVRSAPCFIAARLASLPSSRSKRERGQSGRARTLMLSATRGAAGVVSSSLVNSGRLRHLLWLRFQTAYRVLGTSD